MTRGRFIAVRLALSVLLLGATSRCALASDSETNVWRRAVQRLSFSAFADIESAYWARGAIVDKRPFSAQYADLSVDLDPFGRVGGYAWSCANLPTSSAVRSADLFQWARTVSLRTSSRRATGVSSSASTQRASQSQDSRHMALN